MDMIHDLTGLPPNRRTAILLQLPTYAPTQPCRNGHLAPMETRRQRCRQCLAASDMKVADAKRVALSNARAVARMEAKKLADSAREETKKQQAREAAETARREAAEARSKQKASEKAASTRAANKAARQAAKQASSQPAIAAPVAVDDVSPYAVREVGVDEDEGVPW